MCWQHRSTCTVFTKYIYEIMKLAIHEQRGSFSDKWIEYCKKKMFTTNR